MSALSELLVASLPQGMSRRAVARKAQEKGYQLGDATATAYFRGDHGVPDDATLAAFAAVLDVSEAALRKAAGLAEEQAAWTPPEASRYLSGTQKRALDQLIRAMTERQVPSDGTSTKHDNVTPLRTSEAPVTGVPKRKAARPKSSGRNPE